MLAAESKIQRRTVMEPQVPNSVVGSTVEDLQAMDTTQYISYAEECFRMALIAKSKGEETAWLEISSSWLRLAGLNDQSAQGAQMVQLHRAAAQSSAGNVREIIAAE